MNKNLFITHTHTHKRRFPSFSVNIKYWGECVPVLPLSYKDLPETVDNETNGKVWALNLTSQSILPIVHWTTFKVLNRPVRGLS